MGQQGVCEDTSTCTSSGGVAVPGLCPGPSNIQCCVQAPPKGSLGVDISEPTSVSTLQCLNQAGNTFAVVRVFRSSGRPDLNAPANVANAIAGGFSWVDGYVFPCYNCGNPAGQMKSAIGGMSGSQFNGTYWLDVEAPNMWDSNTANNVNFIQAMVSQGQSMGVNLGIYTRCVNCLNVYRGFLLAGSSSLSISGGPVCVAVV